MPWSMVSRSDPRLVAFRLGSVKHNLLDGTGAATSDSARWNSRGRYVIYAAEHYATAVLEKAAQLTSIRLPPSLTYIRIAVPEGVGIEEVHGEDLPGWDGDEPLVSKRFGDRWYDERRSLVLLVPSRAAPGLERNVLINQQHPDFARVTATAAARIVCHPKLLA
jgi:RES domain-containing protein